MAWLLPVAFALAVYYPITRNYFHWDDFLDLYQLQNDDLAQFLLRMYGGHVYIVRNAITLLLSKVLGPDPVGYLAFALLTHLVNVGLVYLAALRLTDSWRLACVAAGIWGIAPANEGAMGWFAVYGQVAATTCTLLVVCGLAAVPRAASGTWRKALGWAALMLAAGMLFGTGIAAALVMPVVAWLMLPASRLRPRAVAALTAAGAMLLVIYSILRDLEPTLYGESRIETAMMLAGLTPAALGQHLEMLSGLFAYGLAVLPLGLLPDPTQFPTPEKLLSLTLGAVVIVAGLWRGPAVMRRRLLAGLLLTLAIYGLISIARSMFLGYGFVNMVRTPRYHYASGAMLSLVLAMGLGALSRGWRVSAQLKNGLVGAWALGTLAMIVGVDHPIDHFPNDRNETVTVLNEIQAAIDAAPAGETVYFANKPFASVGFVNVGYVNRFPGTAAVFAIFHPDNVVGGHQVIFTSTDEDLLTGAARGRRSASLVRRASELPRPGAADKESPP